MNVVALAGRRVKAAHGTRPRLLRLLRTLCDQPVRALIHISPKQKSDRDAPCTLSLVVGAVGPAPQTSLLARIWEAEPLASTTHGRVHRPYGLCFGRRWMLTRIGRRGHLLCRRVAHPADTEGHVCWHAFGSGSLSRKHTQQAPRGNGRSADTI